MTDGSDLRCPQCGEADRLRGRPGSASDQDGPAEIEVTCLACGHGFRRGGRVCRSCGRADGEQARQNLTRHPRGTLLAVVGHRDVLVCPACDSEVIGLVRRGAPIPEDYRPRFLTGRADAEDDTPAVPRQRPDRPKPPRLPPAVYQPPPPPVRKPPKSFTDPTVREATTAYLQAHPDADPVVVTLMGVTLGPATRLSALDRDPAALRKQLLRWLDGDLSRYGEQRRQAAAEQVQAAFALWRDRGWFSHTLELE